MSWDPSPGQRKLVFALTVVVLAAVGVYLTAPGLFGGGSSGREPAAEPAGAGTAATETPAGRPASPTPSSTTTSTPSPAPHRDMVLRFARAFTSTDRSADAWHEAVAPYCTPALADALSYTDPRTVPHGSPTGATRLAGTGETAVEVAVPLDSGTRLLVTVVQAGKGYAVSDVRPGDGP